MNPGFSILARIEYIEDQVELQVFGDENENQSRLPRIKKVISLFPGPRPGFLKHV